MALPSRTTDFIFNTGTEAVNEVSITLDDTADYGGATFFTSDIVVEKNGTVLTETTDYVISGSSPTYIVSFVVPVILGTTPVRIYRRTTRASSLVVYPAATASLDSNRHLNKSTYQWLFIVQELYDMILGCLRAVVSSGSIVWDFCTLRGINCVNPVNDQDVATKKYVDDQDAIMLAAAKAYTDAEILTLKNYLLAYIATYVTNALLAYDTTIKAWVLAQLAALTSSTFAGTTTILEDTITLSPGETVVTTNITVNDGPNVVDIDGAVQKLTTNYTVTGAKEITLVAPYTSSVEIHITHFKIST